MSSASNFRTSIISLWFRLSALAAVALVFGESLWLAPGKAQGWSYYLTNLEVCFEVVVRIFAAALGGILLGTICTAVVVPLLWYFGGSRDRIIDSTAKVFVVILVFACSLYALDVLTKWSYHIVSHRGLFDRALLIVLFVAFALALCWPRSRRAVVTSMDGFQSATASRRIVVATLAGAATLAAVEFVFSKARGSAPLVSSRQQPGANILLITFDALNAEDTSLYGRRLPTTPNLDRFGRQATVFTNFFSSSTFTTSSVAAMMSGLYPSESLVYQLQGRVSRSDSLRSLPYLLRAAGYHTGAFVTNPFAYYLSTSLEDGFDAMPEPAFQPGGLQYLWAATTPLHQDSRIGSRIDEYFDLEHVWNTVGRMPDNLSMRYRPDAAFRHASELLNRLPDGFFLWVHLITPHNPYLPDAVDRGRFLPANELHTYEEEFGTRWKPHYPPDQQPLVDQRRLRYDEFIASGDRALGAFLDAAEKSGRLSNTVVVVSADHGESFEGGVYEHSSPYLTRPVIHIPLVIKTPGQQEGRTVALTADQTSLAPTILELAGVPKPDSMLGPSLFPWLNRGGQGQGQGLAFCQYFERNSVFKPLHHGSIGVIEGDFQYVYYLDKEKGVLRPLQEAQDWTLDRSAEHPDRTRALRATLNTRFPDLVPAS